jgi:HAD superfamily hydrolase (TIGR01509 family)
MGASEAVIFDVDGTLLDWDASIGDALVSVQAQYEVLAGAELTRPFARALADYALVVRDGVVVDRRYWMLFVDPVPPWRLVLSGTDDATVTAVAHRFRSLLRPVLYHDVLPALTALQATHPLAVLSNSPGAEAVVEQLGVRACFEAVVAATEDHRKPHPRAFLEACSAVGAMPGACVYVGDSVLTDIEGALAAGLGAVHVDRYGDRPPLPPGARRVISLEDLPQLFSREL